MTVAGWHLKKEVSIGHLLTTVTIGLAVLAAWIAINVETNKNTDRSERNEQAIMKLIDTDAEHAGLPIHPGAAQNIAGITAELNGLTRQVNRLEARMIRQWDEFNRELRSRNPNDPR